MVKETITSNNQSLIKAYRYDEQDRLTSDQHHDHYFNYDLNGNITRTNYNGVAEVRRINGADQYTSSVGLSNIISYDRNGNLRQYQRLGW